MRDKHRPSNDGPGRDEFQAYIQGDLPEERKEALEAFLSDNPIASDALEGLKWVEKPKKVDAYVTRIRQRTQERIQVYKEDTPSATKRTFRVRPDLQWRPFVASLAGLAAMVLVVFMIIFYTKSNQEGTQGIASSDSPSDIAPLSKIDKPDTEQKSLLEDRSESPSTPALPLIAENSRPGSRNKSTEEDDPKPVSIQVTKSNTSGASTRKSYPSIRQFNHLEIEVEESLALHEPDGRAGIQQSASPLSSLAVLSIPPSTPFDEFDQFELEETITLQSSDVIPSKRKNAKKRAALSRNEAAPQAEGLDFRQQLVPAPLPNIRREASPPENVERTLSANVGIWYFTYDMYSEAEMELQQLLQPHPEKSPSVDWAYSSAQWYLFRIYLATNREGEAKRILREISVYPNPYQDQAQRVLRKL